LGDLMAAGGWKGAEAWARRANGVGPTLVGGSRKHGGPDLGPTRAREAWRKLGVDGRGLADAPPAADAPASYLPRLTLSMAAAIQGFSPDWRFYGRKTRRAPADRQCLPASGRNGDGNENSCGDSGCSRA
jgi:DNA (cytosine-5)-methyltransferase 1